MTTVKDINDRYDFFFKVSQITLNYLQGAAKVSEKEFDSAIDRLPAFLDRCFMNFDITKEKGLLPKVEYTIADDEL